MGRKKKQEKLVENNVQPIQQTVEEEAPIIYKYDTDDKEYKAYGDNNGLNIPCLMVRPDGNSFDLYYLNISREELRKAVGIM